MEAFARVYAAVEAFPAATVCVCVGNVVGAGAELAAGCDLRVGGDNLKLMWAGARMGAPVGPARLVPLVGLATAKELILTGATIGMDEASARGLLHRTAPAAEAESVAIALARRGRRARPGRRPRAEGDVRRARAGPRAGGAREPAAGGLAAHGDSGLPRGGITPRGDRDLPPQLPSAPLLWSSDSRVSPPQGDESGGTTRAGSPALGRIATSSWRSASARARQLTS